MVLTDRQQAILDGKEGDVKAKVMKTLVMYGEAFGAEKMVDITGKHGHLVTSFGLSVMKPVYDLMDTLIPSISQEDAPPALVALFTYMTENPDLCQALYGKSWESEFTRNAKKLIAERCLGEFAPDGGTEEQKYMLAFAVNGCFGTIVAWQEAGFQPPAAEIARITWQAIRAVKGRM